MKTVKLTLFAFIATVIYLSCQKEYSIEGISSGWLKKDTLGNCSPVLINGNYKADTIITSANYIDVQVEVSLSGTYQITSDTVNGYYFSNSGYVTTGTNMIRLFGRGKPQAEGTDNFRVTYDSSNCNFSINVIKVKNAIFTLGGAPNGCSGATTTGIYIAGTALTANNKITVQVNVSFPGLYSITASTNNGFQFSGSGIFTNVGLQNVTLSGSGTPVSAGISNVVVSNAVSTCNFPITIQSNNQGGAVFSFDGTPGPCINDTVNGTYYAGIATNPNNTVIMNVTVTVPGSYNITTNTANGVTFRNTGSFINAGQQQVTLTAIGTPFSSGLTGFVPNTGASGCGFSVNIQPLPPPALFTLSGSPNACTPVTVNGFYIVTKPLDASNTIVVQVNVTTTGSYHFFTNTVNGITFSASGVFTTTGLQNLTLIGSGTPLAKGLTNLLVNNSTSGCSFSVTVQ